MHLPYDEEAALLLGACLVVVVGTVVHWNVAGASYEGEGVAVDVPSCGEGHLVISPLVTPHGSVTRGWHRPNAPPYDFAATHKRVGVNYNRDNENIS